MAITKNWPIHFQIVVGSFKSDSYQAFILEVSEKLPASKHYLIQDNAVIHHKCTSGNPLHEMVYLPPYSPFINPIECVFSKLKRHIRSKMSMDGIVIESRLNYVKQMIQEEINSHEYNDLRRYYRHISNFFIDIAQKNDIFGD